MNVDVVLLPAYLSEQSLHGKSVIVIDALRATTTMASAFAAGVKVIRIFPDFETAMAAAKAAEKIGGPRPILCGEVNALPPPGADLGNSPLQWKPEHKGRDVFLATTNGTKAIFAVRSAGLILTGALVNRTAVARAAAAWTTAASGRDILILCSGTSGAISLEDTICAGAILDVLRREFEVGPVSDVGLIAYHTFLRTRDNLVEVLREGKGGRNNIAVGLDADIDFAARLDVYDLWGVVDPETLTISANR
jgi:2-phosphosulfolactate phosphatase